MAGLSDLHEPSKLRGMSEFVPCKLSQSSLQIVSLSHTQINVRSIHLLQLIILPLHNFVL